MSTQSNRIAFDQWLQLRTKFREEKRSNNYSRVIEISLQIIELEKSAKFISIMAPIFLKEIGNAYIKLGDVLNAIKYYEQALEGFIEYRATAKLSQPDDWLKDTYLLEKKILKLQSKPVTP